jgi:serine protease Do
MAPKDYALKLGEPISVMGYPAISPERKAVTKGHDLIGATEVEEVIPEPTLTNGIIAKLNSAEVNLVQANSNVSLSQDSLTLTQRLADYFQLTVAATGAGNSGGPIFNGEGKVIGLFTASKTDDEGTRVTYGVPIKYGWDIYGRNPVIQ